MKNQLFSCVLLLVMLFAAVGVDAADETEMAGFFPDLSGWKKADPVAWYHPESLYEYINGAAENYLNYEFQLLGVQNYKNAQNQTLTVDIYRHSTVWNGFGIYSSEKPLAGNFLALGGQGYQEEGVLNFFHGRYYVKMSGYDVGAADQQKFPEYAAQIVKKIGDQPGIPAEVALFPGEGKAVNSERFILSNLFGHPFLKEGFVAEYTIDGKKCRAFLISGTAAADVEKMARAWLQLANPPLQVETFANPVSFQDRYNGPVVVQQLGARLIGTVNAPEKQAGELLKNFLSKLKAK